MKTESVKKNQNDLVVNTTSFLISFKHCYHLVAFYSLLLLLIFFLAPPFLPSQLTLYFIILLSPIIPTWQTNVIAPNAYRRAYHLQSRLLYWLFIFLIFSFKYYIVNDKPFDLNGILLVSILFLFYSGLFSLLFYHIKVNLFRNERYSFLPYLKWFIPLAVLFVLATATLKEGWFNSNYNDIKIWSEENPFGINDFKGYPDFFTIYDAAIFPEIEFAFGSLDQLKYINTVCQIGKTWINPWDRDAYFLIQHEAYHFHIAEMCSRMARKEVYKAIQLGASKDSIIQIIQQHQLIESLKQAAYDEETDHSVQVDKQSEWQYIIDSTLYDLDPYWTSTILKKQDVDSNLRYFRNIRINDKGKIEGLHELMAGEEDYAQHYRFTYEEKPPKLTIAYFENQTLTKDPQFGVASIKVISKGEYKTDWFFYNQIGDPTHNHEGYHYRKSNGNAHVLKAFFYDSLLNPKQLSGFQEIVYEMDHKGRITSLKYFNHDGIAVKVNNIHEIKYYYKNGEDLAYTKEGYDKGGKATLDEDGVFKYHFKYDSVANLIEQYGLDYEGKYVYNESYTIERYEYDELGYINKISYYDEFEKLAEDENGIAILVTLKIDTEM